MSPGSCEEVMVSGPFYVDSHIHVYPCFDQVRMLDAASAHVAGYDDGRGVGVLAMTELSHHQVFRRWRDEGGVGPWEMKSFGEPAVLFAYRDGELKLIVLAGRQIVTRRRLGVLALGVDEEYDDGIWIEDAVDRVASTGALPVVSYGWGKWWGRRGAVVDRIVEEAEPGELAIGEIGVRPTWGPQPRQFEAAALRGLTILPGSDPLVLKASERVVCSYCVRVDGMFRRETLGAELIEQLRWLGPAPPRYGGHLSSPRAVYQQIAMRIARKMLALRGQERVLGRVRGRNRGQAA